jgi:hypothetical protein
MKKFLVILSLVIAFVEVHPMKASCQHPEIGLTIVLSPALMFGPYVSYWFDDHNAVEASILAGLAEGFRLPVSLNAGYNYFFGSKEWRPSLGLQYTLMMPTPTDRKSLLTVLPGVERRWDENQQDFRINMWVSAFLEKEKVMPWWVMPIGLEFYYGYKFD